MFKSSTNPNPNNGMLSRVLWLLVPSFLMTEIYFFNASTDKIMGSLAVFLFSFLLVFQIRILVAIFKTSWQKTIDYYSTIVKKRKEHEGSGYIESYKHIREHGNSFLIVAFQFFLALPIFVFVSQPAITSEDSIKNLLIIVLLWVLPAATIWAFGNKLENNLQSM